MGSGHQMLERTLAERGVHENVALRVPHFVVVPLIVAGTDLVVSLPSRVAGASARLVKVKVHPLPIPIPSFDVSLYWHRARRERRRQPLAARRDDRAVRRPPERRAAMTRAKTPVFLLTGFLGSGKTTLLNAALREPALANTAVVVNELGEIGLDNLIIAQATDNVVLLDAGCLCCANTGALHETLADLDGRRARGEIPPFERVIIETSGAADPAPLLNVLLGHPLVTGAYAFEATVCAVDAQHFLASRRRISRARQAGRDRRAPLRHQERPRRCEAGFGLLEGINPEADVLASPAELFSTYEQDARKYHGLVPRPDPLPRAFLGHPRACLPPPSAGDLGGLVGVVAARPRGIRRAADPRQRPAADRRQRQSLSCRACRACSTRRSASATGRTTITATAWSASRATSRKKTSR